MTVKRRTLVSSFSTALLGGCGALWRPNLIAMDLLQDDRACTSQAPVLLVEDGNFKALFALGSDRLTL